MFSTVGIVTKPNDPLSEKTAKELFQHIESKGIHVIKERNKIDSGTDLIIAIGGDGTLLNTARSVVDKNIPMVGINLGRLGFLADINVDDMKGAMDQVLAGVFTEEKRFLLSCEIDGGSADKPYLAFNDVVIHRKERLRMIEFDVFIDNSFINTQRADGLIIATPTGSTAYSLSSGGPIMHPGIEAIGIVSICPHTMSHRPLIVPSNKEITVKIRDVEEGVNISFDGHDSFHLKSDQTIKIKQHINFVNLLHPEDYDYFQILRNKLHWGGKF